MPIYNFERAVYPYRHASPFLSSKKVSNWNNVKFPGGIIEGDGDDLGPTKGKMVGEDGLAIRSAAPTPTTTAPVAAYQQMQYGQQLQQYQPYQYQQQQQAAQVPVPVAYQSEKASVDRSITKAAAAPGMQVTTEPIPPEIGMLSLHAWMFDMMLTLVMTAKLFDRDPETDELLWFPGQPVNAPPVPQPRYSLTYLHFLAKKRKQEMEGRGEQAKKAKTTVLPTVNETLWAVMKGESA